MKKRIIITGEKPDELQQKTIDMFDIFLPSDMEERFITDSLLVSMEVRSEKVKYSTAILEYEDIHIINVKVLKRGLGDKNGVK